MTRKVALFAFNGDQMCFVHVLLNSLDMADRGYDVKLVIEGSATGLIPRFSDPAEPFKALYSRVLSEGLIDSACKACCSKMGTLGSAREQGIRLSFDMSGHPSIARYIEDGYEIMTF
ncbi:MAG: cytoplasmic protein [Candidatus Thermoplasmatota archaeon]|nr:cytoplasmic protein [Candidatus Thermoplasmatota archaeon]